jgi:hypothetical protein
VRPASVGWWQPNDGRHLFNRDLWIVDDSSAPFSAAECLPPPDEHVEVFSEARQAVEAHRHGANDGMADSFAFEGLQDVSSRRRQRVFRTLSRLRRR